MRIVRVGIIITVLSAQGFPAEALKPPSWIHAVTRERPALDQQLPEQVRGPRRDSAEALINEVLTVKAQGLSYAA